MEWYRFYDGKGNCIDLNTGEKIPRHVNIIHKPMFKMEPKTARNICDDNELSMFKVNWELDKELSDVE